MNIQTVKSVLIVVAHPEDEKLWTGGNILNNPYCDFFVISLCRKDDADFVHKFYRVLRALNAKLPKAVQQAHTYNVLPELIWLRKYDLITQTHGFKKDAWETQTTPKVEAFWAFHK